jgi:hypothetical protein
MLAVRVDDQDELPFCAANSGLDRRAVALGVRMPHDLRAGECRTFTRRIARAIVDDEDLFPRRLGAQTRDDVADCRFLVECRNHD